MTRGEGRKTQKRGAFGTAHKLPSGRWRAMYWHEGRRYKSPTLFVAEKDARGWLALQQADIIKKVWTPPEALAAETNPRKVVTFKEYADDWLEHRQVKGRPIKDRTREHYRTLLDDHILPTFGALPLASITADDVADWYQRLDASTPTLRAHCYGLLRTILGTAASARKIPANPANIEGASAVKRVHTPRPASPAQVQALAWEMPKQYRAMVLLAAWCALRFGELTELRRADVLLSKPGTDPEGVVRVERAVVRTADGFRVTTPKSDAGRRDVSIPPHIVAAVRRHLEFAPGPNDLLFPADHGGHLAPATLYRHFYAARARVGLPALRWHDLRHTGADLAAVTGATLADLMGRLGHSTPQAAMRYQHASQKRDKELAAKLSKLAGL